MDKETKDCFLRIEESIKELNGQVSSLRLAVAGDDEMGHTGLARRQQVMEKRLEVLEEKNGRRFNAVEKTAYGTAGTIGAGGLLFVLSKILGG